MDLAVSDQSAKVLSAKMFIGSKPPKFSAAKVCAIRHFGKDTRCLYAFCHNLFSYSEYIYELAVE